MQTPEFQGTHLWDRLCWAKENLEPVQTDIRVVYEDRIDECCRILVPDLNWVAAAENGFILPPVESYWELAKDEAQPGFVKHTRGYLLHDTEPVGPMTETTGPYGGWVNYIIMKDIPQHIWRNWNTGNKPRLVICRKDQLPATREWRNAWKISEDLATDKTVAA